MSDPIQNKPPEVKTIDCPQWRNQKHPHGGYCKVAGSTVSHGVCADCLKNDKRGMHLNQKKSVFDPHIDCAFKGKETGESVECPTCSGSVKIKIFECSQFGRCTIGKKSDGIACCKICDSHSAKLALQITVKPDKE